MSGDDVGDGTNTARNVVAIFHASFHPTKGNTVDWACKTDDSISLDGVEFNVLPSGLHLIERDIVYFSHGEYTGLAAFRRRPTRAENHRGFRLSSLGILLQATAYPKPWLLASSLRTLADSIYDAASAREDQHLNGTGAAEADLLGLGSAEASTSESNASGDLAETDFAPAREWFEQRRAKILESESSWSGWVDELDGLQSSSSTPTHHLPHLLRILGLSSLTLYKCVLSRRRILIYTLPPVEIAGVLAWVAADMCREHHMGTHMSTFGVPIGSLLGDRKNNEYQRSMRESPRVLGMVTLNDISRLEAESATGRGWIACTTDALFMEKPQYYDLIIDLTTSTPSKSSRPSLYLSKPKVPSLSAKSIGKKKIGWKLESVRFTWSDVRVWSELDRILKLDSAQTASHSHPHPHISHNRSDGSLCLSCAPPPIAKTQTQGSSNSVNSWSDAYRIYEDVCLLCATLWIGLGTWRSNSRQSFESSTGVGGTGSGPAEGKAWGAARSASDEDYSLEGTRMRTLGRGIEGLAESPARVRSRGLGIEGRPPRRIGSESSHARKASTATAITTASSLVKEGSGTSVECTEVVTHADGEGESDDANVDGNSRQNTQTTLALLQTFHANTVFWLSKLREAVPPPSAVSSPGLETPRYNGPCGVTDAESEDEAIVITARDLISLELGVLSDLDARFVEWLVEAEGYASTSVPASVSAMPSRRGRKVVVKRGWQELLGIMVGLK